MEAIFSSALVAGTPLLFATLGAITNEKAGNMNLGVEGMMLLGALMGFKVGIATSNPIFALCAALLAGAAGAAIYAFLTVTLRANQVVTGLTLTTFGVGLSNFLGKSLVGQRLSDTFISYFKPIEIPILGDIPFIGPVFFNKDILVYMGYIVAIALGIYFFKTRQGLQLRSVGENPAAADASGINVNLYKYVHILLGGALCGLGGAYLSLVYVPAWQENITAGRGWIAIALVIFASWNPYKALLGAYLFGGLDILGFRLQAYHLPISQHFLDMIPYLATIAVLVIESIRSKKGSAAPKSLGNPYFREDR